MSLNKNRLKHYAARVKSAEVGLQKNLIARLAGVTFDSRQQYIEQVEADTPIKLERDRRNKFDFHAVGVWANTHSDNWVHVGFIPRAMSKLISRSLDNGVQLVATVHRRTGGMLNEETNEKLHYGLEIKLTPPALKE